jgi:hypothetical protein
MGWVDKVAAWYLRRRRANASDDTLAFHWLMAVGANTAFGREHDLKSVRDYKDFCARVPIRTYEELYPYIERTLRGEADVLWPGKAEWFAKSSGTTNDRSKFIPITNDNLQFNHYAAGKDMVAAYLRSRPDSRVLAGKTLSIGGSHHVSPFNASARVGDISAVLLQNLPAFYERRRAPRRDIALMSQWEEKIEAMARDVYRQNITAIVGVPTWTVVLIEKIFELDKKENPGKTAGRRDLSRIWPNLEVFFHGGVSFTPYEQLFRETISSPRMTYREVYNASEGFFAFQDRAERGMKLLLDREVFFEFVPTDGGEPRRVKEVEIGVPYAVIITTSSGLWRYALGDVVKFVDPERIAVVGRTKHFINAFGEEVMVENADAAVAAACSATAAIVADYSAAPFYFERGEKGGHEWIVECKRPPDNPELFVQTLDRTLRNVNSDYDAKRQLALAPPKVHFAPPGLFEEWLRRRNKLGGQNKVPRLCNDRRYLDVLLALLDQMRT